MTAAVAQHVEDSVAATGGATFSRTLTGVQAGSTLLAFFTRYNSTGACTCADDVNGDYGAAVEDVNDGGIPQTTGVFKFENSAAGTITVTVTFATSCEYRGVWFVECRGVKTSSVLDGHTGQVQTGPGGGTDAITSGNTTSANQPALVVGLCLDNNANNPAAGTGFTDHGLGWDFTEATGFARLESKRVTATGSQAATFTGHAGSRSTTLVVVLDEAAGGTTIATGRADETDAAFALAASKARATGRADETDVAFALAASKTRATGRADETDAAFALDAIRGFSVGRADETDVAFALVPSKSRACGRADEADVAFALLLEGATTYATERLHASVVPLVERMHVHVIPLAERLQVHVIPLVERLHAKVI